MNSVVFHENLSGPFQVNGVQLNKNKNKKSSTDFDSLEENSDRWDPAPLPHLLLLCPALCISTRPHRRKPVAGRRCKSGAEGKAGEAWRTERGRGTKPDIAPHGHSSKVCIWEQLSLPSASPPGKYGQNINCAVNSAYRSFSRQRRRPGEAR